MQRFATEVMDGNSESDLIADPDNNVERCLELLLLRPARTELQGSINRTIN